MSLQSDAYYKAAKKNLDQAREEYYKPVEDVVSHSACKGSLLAIVDFMKGFLIENDVELELEDTVASLYYKCLGISPKFKEIDIHSLYCKCDTIGTKSCVDMNKISKCIDVANAIEKILDSPS
jgi:hypothetical protein